MKHIKHVLLKTTTSHHDFLSIYTRDMDEDMHVKVFALQHRNKDLRATILDRPKGPLEGPITRTEEKGT